MSKMLINAYEEDILRVALIDDEKRLYDLDIEKSDLKPKKGNIHKGEVVRIEPSLEAAFIDYGGNRHGFLPIKEILRSYFEPSANLSEKDLAHPHIKDVIKEGQKLMVQIEKEERGNKGAALTTRISLPGSYLVLMPNNPEAGGISRRIEGKVRDDLRENMAKLDIPEGMGIIIRTAGVGKSADELKWDLNALLKLWEKIVQANQTCEAPCLIYQEGDAVLRSIRDHLRQDINEIIVDNFEIYERSKQYLEEVRPDFANKITYYQDKIPLFSFYTIEHQIESAYQRIVRLPSGGAIVIDHTEALVSIDVNSAKATSGGDIEETALNTNLEASDEIARQLRLRDIGGLIVIDFIDMTPLRNQKAVYERLRKALSSDSARTQIGNISRFGLLEMSRQRLRPSLGESLRMTCPRCDGQGTIRGIESLAVSILHLIEEESIKKDTFSIHVQLPVDLATFMLNERRNRLNDIEKRQGIRVLLLPNPDLETPNYKIKRLTKEDATGRGESSYKLLEEPEIQVPQVKSTPVKPTKEPIVRITELEGGAPSFSKKIKGLLGQIFGKEKTSTPSKTIKTSAPSTVKSTHQPRSGGYRGHYDYQGRRRPPGGDRRGSGRGGPPQKPRKPQGQGKPQQRPVKGKSRSYETPPPAEFSSENYPEINADRSRFDDDFSQKPKSQSTNEKPIKSDEKTN